MLFPEQPITRKHMAHKVDQSITWIRTVHGAGSVDLGLSGCLVRSASLAVVLCNSPSPWLPGFAPFLPIRPGGIPSQVLTPCDRKPSLAFLSVVNELSGRSLALVACRLPFSSAFSFMFIPF